MFKNILIGIFIGIIINGCAFQPQELHLDIKTGLQQSNIGNNVEVYVKVVDDRETTDIGHRGSADGQHAKITAKNNLVLVVKEAIIKGLEVNNL